MKSKQVNTHKILGKMSAHSTGSISIVAINVTEANVPDVTQIGL